MESAFADQARQSRLLDFSVPIRTDHETIVSGRGVGPVVARTSHYHDGRGRDGEAITASRTARMPVRERPANVPAPPIESTGAPRSPSLSNCSRSSPLSDPIEAPVQAP